MFQRGGQHFGLHHLKRGVELFKKFGVVFALRVGQFDGQRLHADGLVGKDDIEAEIEEVGANAILLKRSPLQEIHDETTLRGTLGAHGLIDEGILSFGQPIIRGLGQMRHHPCSIVGSTLVFIKEQLKQFLLEVATSQSSGIASADSAGQYGFQFGHGF